MRLFQIVNSGVLLTEHGIETSQAKNQRKIEDSLVVHRKKSPVAQGGGVAIQKPVSLINDFVIFTSQYSYFNIKLQYLASMSSFFIQLHGLVLISLFTVWFLCGRLHSA